MKNLKPWSFILVLLAFFSCGTRSGADARQMRYVKSVKSADRSVEFMYNDQNQLIEVVEKEGGPQDKIYTNVYKYIYGDEIRVDCNGKQKASICPAEDGASVRIVETTGNMQTANNYVLSADRRIAKKSDFLDDYDYRWENGNLTCIESPSEKTVFTYGEQKAAPVNVDLINWIYNYSAQAYPVYSCCCVWGQSERLPVVVEDAQYGWFRSEFSYELDADGYVARVKEHTKIETDYRSEIVDNVYEVTYCD